MSNHSKLAQLLTDTLTFVENNYTPDATVYAPSKSTPIAKPVVQRKALKPMAYKPKPKPTTPKVKPIKAPVVEAPKAPAEKPKAPAVDEMHDIRALVERLSPHLITEEPIPDDAIAKRASEAWKQQTQASEVTILSLSESQEDTTFLRNVTRAISERLKPAKVVSAKQLEQDNLWESFLTAPELKWILTPPLDMAKWPHLSAHYKQNATTSEHFLGSIPLVFLKPLAEYRTHPLLKKELWDTLCQLL